MLTSPMCIACIQIWMLGVAVRSLDYTSKGLTKIPKEVMEATDLKRLDLSYNKLKTLPKGIGGLTQLEWLGLGNNKLTTLPKGIGGLTRLQVLDLNSYKLTTLPKGIGGVLLGGGRDAAGPLHATLVAVATYLCTVIPRRAAMLRGMTH